MNFFTYVIIFLLFAKTCIPVLFNLQNFSISSFSSILQRSDNNPHLRRIHIRVYDSNANLMIMGTSLDSFLIPRPWWIVLEEPYTWQNRSDAFLFIRLFRYNDKYTRHLRISSKLQYPKKCDSRLIVAFSSRFHTWGVLYEYYKAGTFKDVRAILVPYVYDPSSKNTIFLDENYCPDTKNKYECAFLPVTNCTLPRYTSNCTTNSCMHSFFMYAHANNQTQTSSEREMQRLAATDHSRMKYLKLKPTDISARGYRGEYDDRVVYEKTIMLRQHEITFVYGFLFRLNFDFRSRVAHREYEFLKSYSSAVEESSSVSTTASKPFPENGNCVVVHIRRTDRVKVKNISNTSAEILCERHRMHKNRTCLNPHTGAYDTACSVWHNLGCETGIPFASLELNHFLNAAARISLSRNLFVMTDDPSWLTQHIPEVRKDWNFYVLGARPDNRKNSIANGVDFLASLSLASRCSGLVAHMRSAVGRILLRTMCNRHANTTGTCPVFFDLSFPTWTSPWTRI